MPIAQDTALPPLRLAGSVDGTPVHEILLRGPEGMEASVLTWGAVIRDLVVPLATGVRQPVVLGLARFEDYPTRSPYFGAIAGRFANRIAGGTFTLDGQTYPLDRNEGTTTLHGGTDGFSQRVWQVVDRGMDFVTLGLASPDRDQGFPGRVEAACTYRLTKGRALEVGLRAITDAPTPVSLAQHSYWNLDGSRDISDHYLTVMADHYTPVRSGDLPTGEIADVSGTPFDLRRPLRVGDIAVPLDTNYALNPAASGLIRAAELSSDRSGLRLTVSTTKPGLQVYDGHKIDLAAVPGTHGRHFAPQAGMCLETQFFPDSPNQPDFPDAILRPGQIYSHRTVYGFDGPGV